MPNLLHARRLKGLTAIHRKTNRPYKIIDVAIDATNDTAGRMMVIYTTATVSKAAKDTEPLFTREVSEFTVKFDVPNG